MNREARIPLVWVIPIVIALQPGFASADEVVVKSGDTLWSIAKGSRTDDSVSIQQQVDAIVQHNPHAFVDGDPGQMLYGATLTLPAASGTRPAAKQQPAVVTSVTASDKTATPANTITRVRYESAQRSSETPSVVIIRGVTRERFSDLPPATADGVLRLSQ